MHLSNQILVPAEGGKTARKSRIRAGKDADRPQGAGRPAAAERYGARFRREGKNHKI